VPGAPDVEREKHSTLKKLFFFALTAIPMRLSGVVKGKIPEPQSVSSSLGHPRLWEVI
jgi:hypothetical protein